MKAELLKEIILYLKVTEADQKMLDDALNEYEKIVSEYDFNDFFVKYFLKTRGE